MSRNFKCRIDCSDRIPGCHALCEKYLNEKRKHEAERTIENINRNIEGRIHSYFKDSYAKRRRNAK